MYKEEESERARLMEDIIRIYERIKSQDGNHVEIEKKISIINEKVAYTRIPRGGAGSPRQFDNDYGDTLSS